MSLRLVMSEYSGFVGLNTETEDFSWHVMQPEELIEFFKDHAPMEAAYAYPEAVASAFGRAPIFTVSDIQPGYGFNLRATIHSNPEPRGCAQTSASFFLPRDYVAEDQVTFAADDTASFGRGTCRIDSTQVNHQSGQKACMAKWLLGVKNRPAVFLKVRNPDQSIHPNVMIFFPDKPNEFSHYPVRFGEAFVLVKQGTHLTQELKQTIFDNFSLLVKQSYGVGNGLYDTAEHDLLESSLQRQCGYQGGLDW